MSDEHKNMSDQILYSGNYTITKLYNSLGETRTLPSLYETLSQYFFMAGCAKCPFDPFTLYSHSVSLSPNHPFFHRSQLSQSSQWNEIDSSIAHSYIPCQNQISPLEISIETHNYYYYCTTL